MPTPFMHLAAAHRFLNDASVPPEIRAQLGGDACLGAFLLGNVAPDARVSGGHSRAKTHFFEYGATIHPRASHNLFASYPALRSVKGQHQAFMAGYLAHLALDEVWSEALLYPYFYAKPWGDQLTRFTMLHVLLCYLDARDYRQWEDRFPAALQNADPHDWLPVLPDSDLRQWRDIIARQICTDCQSETLAVLGARVAIKPEGVRAILDDPVRMQAELWEHVPLNEVKTVEDKMYAVMRTDIVDYVTESLE